MASQPQVGLVPPFTRETAVQKVRKAEDGWNSAIHKKLRWLTRWTAVGAIARNSSTAAKKLFSS